jgi:hypothetical protein
MEHVVRAPRKPEHSLRNTTAETPHSTRCKHLVSIPMVVEHVVRAPRKPEHRLHHASKEANHLLYGIQTTLQDLGQILVFPSRHMSTWRMQEDLCW